MRKYVKKCTPEQRSAINRANGLKGAARRKEMDWASFRRSMKGQHPLLNMPTKKGARIYTCDYIVLHRYCVQEKRTKLDVLHDLIAPLREKIKDAVIVRPDDPWLQTKPTEEY